MFIIKALIIIICVAVGAVFLAESLGVTVPLVQFKGITAHEVPVGIGFLVLAAVIAIFWEVRTDTEETKTTQPDGTFITTTKTTKKGFR
jgi:hypothetical protein